MDGPDDDSPGPISWSGQVELGVDQLLLPLVLGSGGVACAAFSHGGNGRYLVLFETHSSVCQMEHNVLIHVVGMLKSNAILKSQRHHVTFSQKSKYP